jgi:hypothetical protein
MKRQFLLMILVLATGIELLPPALARKTNMVCAVDEPARRVKLGGVRPLKTAFQNDQGKVRLVALVSPT